MSEHAERSRTYILKFSLTGITPNTAMSVWTKVVNEVKNFQGFADKPAVTYRYAPGLHDFDVHEYFLMVETSPSGYADIARAATSIADAYGVPRNNFSSAAVHFSSLEWFIEWT